MENKEVKIEVPEGYVIDKKNSTFECIKFKPKKFSYENIASELFVGKECYYYIDQLGQVMRLYDDRGMFKHNPNNATTEKQLEKLLAYNKLMTVAKYLNDGWKPNWNDGDEYKYFISVCPRTNEILISSVPSICSELAYFKTKELAQKAVDILGKETILLTLSTDY